MDNLLFVLEGGDLNRIDHLIRDLKHSIRPFIGTQEELNQNAVTFLDVDFVKDDLWRRSGLISYLPYIKPTSLRQVLSLSSTHSPSVHGSWMIAYMLRLRRHSNSLDRYLTAKNVVLDRLRKAGIDHAFFHELMKPPFSPFQPILLLVLCHL